MLGNRYIMAVAGCVFLSTCVCAMENNPLELVHIKDWQGVMPFADKMVAYTATSNYLDNDKDKYFLPLSRLGYGYVNRDVEVWDSGSGYQLSRLLKKDGVPGNTALTNKYIHKNFYMREVTAQEARNIIQALTFEEAKFAHKQGDEKHELISKLHLIK